MNIRTAFILSLFAASAASAQITSNQTSEVPSDNYAKPSSQDPTLAQNPNTSMEASSGATSSGSEAAATSGPATNQAGAGPAPAKKKASKHATKKKTAKTTTATDARKAP